jgi:hypothetical protein
VNRAGDPVDGPVVVALIDGRIHDKRYAFRGPRTLQ